MNYAIFSANYLPNIGGIEKFTDGLARELVRGGDRVTIVTNNVFDLAEHEELVPGLDIVRLPCRPLIGGRMPVSRRSTSFKRLWLELCGRRFDGVLVNARFYLHSLLGIELAERVGVHAVVLDHGSAYLTFGNPALDVAVRAYEHAFTALVKRYDVDFYGVSGKSAEWLETFGIKAKGVLSNAIDADAFVARASDRDFRAECEVPEDEVLIAYAGRLIPEKGIECLLEAFETARQRGCGCHLAIAGDGPLRERVEHACNTDACLHMVGPLGVPDVASLFMQADVVALPSRSEGFSTTLLESAACGTPAISTDVGGARELGVGEECGVLLSGMNASELADAFCACAQGQWKLTGGDSLARRVRERFSWRATADAVRAACARAGSCRL